MPNHHQNRILRRVLLLVIVIAFFTAACGSSQDEESQESQAIPYESSMYEESLGGNLASWSSAVAPEGDLSGIFTKCIDADGNETEEYQLVRPADEEQPEELVFVFSPAFRFHPTDDPGVVPERRSPFALSSLAELGEARKVYVVDRGLHGIFIRQIIHVQTGIMPELVTVGDPGDLVTDSLLASKLGRDIDEGSIVNLSLGTYVCSDSDKWIGSQTRQAILDRIGEGTTFVVAAGNSEFDQPMWPAALSGDQGGAVWSVGAYDPSIDDLTRSCFSNYGGWVTAWAPGDEIQPDETMSTIDGLPITWSGTSFATPQVLSEILVNGAPSVTDTPRNPKPGEPPHTDTNGNETLCPKAFGYKPGRALP